jgi:thiazolylpeptide-type bacteriocin precursor
MALNNTLTNNLAEFNLNEMDLESLEISDFLDEKKLSSAEEISNVMAASCTTCECCCSVSTAVIANVFSSASR